MLIILHDSYGNELGINTDTIVSVIEQTAKYPTVYILSTTTGVSLAIKESPQEVARIEEQAILKRGSEK